MVAQVQVYLLLFALIVVVGQLFNKSSLPLSLLLVITGMLLSFFPNFPQISLNPELVLNVFLPIMIYQISAFSSWKDVKKNMGPITLLSIGHVVFITILVAGIMHALISNISWPLAFVLGAVISPPDDVAIVSIAEKIRMPQRIVTILEGEGVFNDAAALILFRFALAALVTHSFSAMHAVSYFFAVIIGETLYGLVLGHVLGELRLKITNTTLHVMGSYLIPFIAYFPAEMLGGSGVLATAVTGFVIGHRYSVKFSSEFRLFSRALWPASTFAIQCMLFLLVGLNMRFIYNSISVIPLNMLMLYGGTIIATVVLGRFLWVYSIMIYLPRLLFVSVRRKKPVPWQYPIVLSWAGMRGSISLAAALAIPALPMLDIGVNPRDLIIFLVFCVIAVTFVLQGLTLPWLLKTLGLKRHGQRERYNEHLMELRARVRMTKAVLQWLSAHKEKIVDDAEMLKEINLHMKEYSMFAERLERRISEHDGHEVLHDERSELLTEVYLLSQIILIEREELLRMWREEKITFSVRNKLLDRLDHRTLHLIV